MSKKFKYSTSFLLLTIVVAISFYPSQEGLSQKINGMCFVAPPHAVDTSHISPIKSVNANWLAVVPYAFSRGNTPKVTYNHDHQWRGETEEGIIETIVSAHQLGLKVMMKPHIWVRGQGWAGEYDLKNEAEWKTWEKDYSAYIMRFARISDSLHVEMICIGTEYKNAVKKRPDFWVKLIEDIRVFYDGKITYAANWDNYENVTFWDKLDYIGIDAYFPVSKSKTPLIEEMVKNWIPIKEKIKQFSIDNKRPILFTEFGYRSMDYCAAGHWELDHQNTAVNLEGQANATEAIFRVFWNEEWFAGGFLWKWFADSGEGGAQNSHYTPQNKPVEKVIRDWYKTNL